MKCAIVKASFLAECGTWQPRQILADVAALDGDIERAEANLKRAKQRLARAKRAKATAMAREAELVASGKIALLASGGLP